MAIGGASMRDPCYLLDDISWWMIARDAYEGDDRVSFWPCYTAKSLSAEIK